MNFIHKAKADHYQPRICRFCDRINHGGFTLIELIVVMTLIGIVFFFAIPRLDSSFFTNSSRQISNWITLHVNSLKNKAIAKQVSYVMKIDMGKNRISCFAGPVNNSDILPESSVQADAFAGTNRTEESQPNGLPVAKVSKKPKKDDFSLPDRYRISDVLFAGGIVQATGTVEIHFYPKGYSDRAIIHVKDDNGNTMSYIIEPFLPQVIIKDDYAKF